MARAILGGRVVLTRRTAVLAAGDLLAIAVFVAAGEVTHNRPVLSGVGTFLQFAVGWGVAATLAGAYGHGAPWRPRRALVVGAGTWVVAALIAQFVRALLGPGFEVPVAFLAVSVLVGGALIAGWRGLAAVLAGRSTA